MNKKTQIQVQDINRLMYYDRSKTINEQFINPMLGMPITMTNPVFIDPYKYRHEILDVLAIGAMFVPYIGPVLSIGIDLGNAALYYHEGDKAMAGLIAAFAIIPFGELVRMVPGVKKGGIELITRALQKAKAGKGSSKAEADVIESVVENSSKINRKAKRELLKKTFKEGFKKLTLKEKVAVAYKYMKTFRTMGGQGFGLMNQGVIQMGGIFLTYAMLISAYGLDGSEPDLDLQKEIEKHENEISDKIIEDLDSVFGKQAEERDDEFIKLLNEALESIENPEAETTNNVEKSSKDEEIIITDYDKAWDYKKVGDEYFTKRKSSNKWIKPTGNALNAIKTKVFKN